MPTLLTHIQVKTNCIPRWEEILRVLVQRTRAEEVGSCLRYEYWRGEEPGHYYALLSFASSTAFYEHQASDYHEEFVDDFQTMFEHMRLEWVDPVENGGSDLQSTRNDAIDSNASESVRAQVALYPIKIAEWWAAAVKQ